MKSCPLIAFFMANVHLTNNSIGFRTISKIGLDVEFQNCKFLILILILRSLMNINMETEGRLEPSSQREGPPGLKC